MPKLRCSLQQSSYLAEAHVSDEVISGITRLAAEFGYAARTLHDASMADLKAVLADGHPVIIFFDVSLETGDPVEISLDGSSITADSMRVTDNGKVLVFDRNVRMTLDPEQSRERGAADPAGKE